MTSFRKTATVCIGAISVVAVTACSSPAPPPDVGVEVFASDTTESEFRVIAPEGLTVELRSDRYYIRVRRSLVLLTPVALVIRGAGSARISTVDTTARVVVQPMGVPPDSAEMAAVVGRVVRLTRDSGDTRVTIELERP